jgi:hypothetical protein
MILSCCCRGCCCPSADFDFNICTLCCSFINRDDLDFAGIASMAPLQEWDLQESNDGSLEYPTQ